MGWVNVIGLGLGTLGAIVALSGLVTSREAAIDVSTPKWGGKQAQEDRLLQRRNATVGLGLIAVGFVLQLIAAWP